MIPLSHFMRFHLRLSLLSLAFVAGFVPASPAEAPYLLDLSTQKPPHVEDRLQYSLNKPIISIINKAQPSPTADLPRLFERFWRKEAARSGGQHVGLGLAVARTFAEAMGGTLTAKMPRPGWLILSLSWTRASSD